MHSLGTGSPASQQAKSEPDSGVLRSNRTDDRALVKGPDARPFVERRQQRPLQNVWHEALETVHRLLMRYEETNQSLMEAEESYRSLFEDAPIGIFRISFNSVPMLVNHALAKLCGYEGPEQMLAAAPCFDEHVFVDRDAWREFLRRVQHEGAQCGFEAEVRLADGTTKWVLVNAKAVLEGGEITHYEGTAEDITDRKKAEDRIKQLAFYDLVTGLPNRPLFEERLAEAIAHADSRNQRVALILLEFDRFKMINDSLGKVFGDRLLQETAVRIKRVLGAEITVARLGGAEFAIILPDARNVREVQVISQQLLTAVGAEFSFLGHSFHVSSTMGISMFPEHGRDGDTLMERADVAMYAAKEQGANEVQFFSEGIDRRIRDRLRLENGLRLALERNELFLVYQPQIDTRTGDVSGLEALLRWQHPEMGLIPPNDFIGVAESSGLIVPIGEWVMRTACSQARKWQDAGLPAVPVAVNVSAIQLRQQGFSELVRRILQETGLSSKFLELELTEGLLMTNVDVMFTLIQELRELGVKLTIDDFGTGYSSLSYLRQFKVNRLKIDRSFVREVPENADDAAITTAIINMAKALNLDVLAEGVENVEQLDFLRAQNCFEIQGFYFSKPMAVDQIEKNFQTASLNRVKAFAVVV
jgi:diguanylate cyclase (GGDEF)-like protein/PAS domain S-box-containing protein